MNTGQINGFELNGSSNQGTNATLQGGFVSTAVLAALVISSAVLTGGLYTEPEAGGRVSRFVTGGAYSNNNVGGIQFKTANLQGSLYSQGWTDSHLNFAPSLLSGASSDSAFGGEVIFDAVLHSADTIGDSTVVGASLTRADGLTGGLETTSYTSGFLVGGVVLMADGIQSTSEVSISELKGVGAVLTGSLESSSDVGGDPVFNVVMTNGIVSYDSIGHELDIQAILHEGVQQISVVGSPVMRLSAELDDGMASNTEFVAQIKISPKSNDGVVSDAILDAKSAVGARITGGISNTSVCHSEMLRAAQRLFGGCTSTKIFQGTQTISPHFNEGFGSSSYVSSNYRISVDLKNGIQTSSGIFGEYIIGSNLYSGVSDISNLSGNLIGGVVFTGSLESTNQCSGQQQLNALITHGCYGNSEVTAALKVAAVLSLGNSTNHELGALQTIQAVLHGNTDSTEFFSANLTTSLLLLNGMSQYSLLQGNMHIVSLTTGGVSSEDSLGGAITEGFTDPNLNNRALSIRSATVLLSIKTPTEDI